MHSSTNPVRHGDRLVVTSRYVVPLRLRFPAVRYHTPDTVDGRNSSALFRARGALALASTTAIVAATFDISRGGRLSELFFATAQTLGVLWLLMEGWSKARQWASATCVLAAAWIPLFLVPSWIFVASPELLSGAAPSPGPALAILNVSVFSLLVAWLAFGGRDAIGGASTPLLRVDAQRLEARWLFMWFSVGLLGILAFTVLAGGPSYVTHLSESGGRSSGLTYIIWLALFLKYAALTRVSHYWATGEGRRRNLLLLMAAVLLLLALFGQRTFLVVVFVQLLLLYTLIRKPLRARIVAPAAIIGITALILGLGTVKRYQGYRSAHKGTDIGFLTYVQTTAVHELVSAYANNYADGVRLIARGRTVVPHETDYESGRALFLLAVQPVPRFVRPEVHVAVPLRPLLESSGGNTHAVPIPLVAYVEFGLIGVAFAGALLGAVLAATDRALVTGHQKLTRVLILSALVVEIPFCLRNSVPRGVSFAALDLLGTWMVAKTSLRGSRESPHPGERPDVAPQLSSLE
jgi:hypothetical protein